MTAITLPGQLELQTVIDHKDMPFPIRSTVYSRDAESKGDGKDVQIAKLLRSYEERPTSETWARIQSLASEILR